MGLQRPHGRDGDSVSKILDRSLCERGADCLEPVHGTRAGGNPVDVPPHADRRIERCAAGLRPCFPHCDWSHFATARCPLDWLGRRTSMTFHSAGAPFKMIAGIFIILLNAPGLALAHCDGMDGPVVKAAEQALATGNPNPVLAWVQRDD